MSSVGITSHSQDHEPEKLREAWRSLNDLPKKITNAEAFLENHDLKLTAHHLRVAKWNVAQVKKAIAVVDQAKTKTQSRNSNFNERADPADAHPGRSRDSTSG